MAAFNVSDVRSQRGLPTPSSSSTRVQSLKLDIDQAQRILTACGGKPGRLSSNVVKLKYQEDSKTEKVIKVTARKLADFLGVRASDIKQKAKEGILETYVADKLTEQISRIREAEINEILENYNKFYEKHKATRGSKFIDPTIFEERIRNAHRIVLDFNGRLNEIEDIGNVVIKRTEPSVNVPEGNIRSYKWSTEIGEGSFGVVYGVFDLIKAREYAVKMAKGRPGAAENIITEQTVLKLLNEKGPHVGVQELSSFKTQMGRYKGPLYNGDLNSLSLLMSSEYQKNVDAGNDKSYEAKLTGNAKIRICEQLVEGLLYCHRKGIRCGDIKPENILWKYSDSTPKTIQAVLSDFGGAEQYSDLEKHFSEFMILLKTETPVVGYALVGINTRAYLCDQDLLVLQKPMSWRDFKKHSEARDVYALGCTMFEFFMGTEPPKENVKIDGKNIKVVTAEAFWKSAHREMVAAGFSDGMAKLIGSMLESDYTKRPTGSELRKMWSTVR
jgi:serine/threonine protein kinase